MENFTQLAYLFMLQTNVKNEMMTITKVKRKEIQKIRKLSLYFNCSPSPRFAHIKTKENVEKTTLLFLNKRERTSYQNKPLHVSLQTLLMSWVFLNEHVTIMNFSHFKKNWFNCMETVCPPVALQMPNAYFVATKADTFAW